MKKQKEAIKPVKRINCPKCGELQLKLYPWANFNIQGQTPVCVKCMNKNK